MTTHKTGTQQEFLAARLDLLRAEKEYTRRGDALAQQRQALPWVRLDKDYVFDTDGGEQSLRDLFAGRSQLLVYHFMFGPDWSAGCPSCSMIADGFNGLDVHLAQHDVMLWAVSRATVEKLLAYKTRMGWRFPWASAANNDFNFDFDVSFTEQQQRAGDIEYNYARGSHAMDMDPPPPPVAGLAASCGTDAQGYSRDRPGMSAFAIEDGVVYHTYSSYARGVDAIWGVYPWLDRAPKGRDRHLVAPSRRIRQALSEAGDDADRSRRYRGVAASRGHAELRRDGGTHGVARWRSGHDLRAIAIDARRHGADVSADERASRRALAPVDG
jgi:predicted dithiol-disulfide oxidoreductase (DUF899 family)